MENHENVILELMERTARIEAKLDLIADMLPQITKLQVDIGKVEQSTKSAHHRIDNIYKVAGLISTIVSVVIALIGRAV